MKKALIAIPIALTIGLSACTSTNSGPKQMGGTFLGAGLGALAGSQVGKGRGKLVSVALGTLIGAGIGNSVGQSLDRADQIYMARTSETAFDKAPTGQTSTWTNPDNGHSGTVTPTRTYQTQGGQYCREFQQTVTVGGDMQEAYGTACRQEDGSWKIG